MSKKSFPIEDGWVHVKVSLEPGAAITQEALLKLIIREGMNTEDYEVAKFTCGKTVARLIVRKKSTVPMLHQLVDPNEPLYEQDPIDRDEITLDEARQRNKELRKMGSDYRWILEFTKEQIDHLAKAIPG